MTIGETIQAIRKEKGYTQKQLAEKCGMATGTIQQYELGKREPKQEQLQKIADAMGIIPARFYLAMYDKQEAVIRNKYFRGADPKSMTEEQRYEVLEANIHNEKELTELQESMRFVDDVIEKAQSDIEERGIQVIVGTFSKLNIFGKTKLLKRALELFEDPRYTQEPPDSDD